MKQGRSITEVAAEIERQKLVKHDYLAPSQSVTMTEDAQRLVVPGAGDFGINHYARRQLAEKLGIPVAYFDRLQAKHPALLAANVNTLNQREPQRVMLRTLDNSVRAVLSDGYRPLDNYDLADAVLPEVSRSGAQIASCEVTETKFYLKLLMPWLDRELPVPENLKMGEGNNWFVRKITGAVTISNSEVGAGALSISPGIFERQCTNLAVFSDQGFRKLHIGKKGGSDDEVLKYLTDETKRIEDAAVWARVRDIVKATMDGRVMDEIVRQLVAARGDAIEDPTKVVEIFAKREGLNETEKGGLLKHLVGSGEMSRYGLSWAVTRLAQEASMDYDRCSELERLGGKVIELPRSDWQVLAKAA